MVYFGPKFRSLCPKRGMGSFQIPKKFIRGVEKLIKKKNPVENGSMLKLGLPYPSLFQLDLYKWASVNFEPPAMPCKAKTSIEREVEQQNAKCKMHLRQVSSFTSFTLQ